MSLAFLVLAGPDNCQTKFVVLKSLWTMFPEDHELVLVRDSFKGMLTAKKTIFDWRARNCFVRDGKDISQPNPTQSCTDEGSKDSRDSFNQRGDSFS
jgi:hypothetical protein